MNVKRHLLVFLLASWLPMQSLAGALLHCELINHPSVHLSDAADHETSAHEHHGAAPIVADRADDPAMHAGHTAHSAATIDSDFADCHGQPALSSEIELPEPPAAVDETPCNHCNGSCHGIQQLSLHATGSGIVSTLNNFSPSSAAAEISSIPENPQRPPKLS